MPTTQPLINEKEVAKKLKDIADKIDALRPHINKATTAFGGLENENKALDDLDSQVKRARQLYS